MTAFAEVKTPEFTDTPQLDPAGATGPVIKITWSVNEVAQAELMHMAKGRLYILFVFVKDNKEIERQVFPYVDGHAGRYLRFHQSGTITVHACIIWHDEGDNPTKRLLLPRNSSKSVDVLIAGPRPPHPDDYDGQIATLEREFESGELNEEQFAAKQTRLRDLERLRYEYNETEGPLRLSSYFYSPISRYALAEVFEVEVPANHFADPKDNWWITRMLAKLWMDGGKSLRDPCDTRLQAIKGLLFSPVMLLLGVFFLLLIMLSTIVKVVTVTFLQLIVGMYDVNYQGIWDFTEPPNSVWEGTTKSRWFYKQTKAESNYWPTYQRRSEITWLLNPPVILAVLFILWLWQPSSVITGASQSERRLFMTASRSSTRGCSLSWPSNSRHRILDSGLGRDSICGPAPSLTNSRTASASPSKSSSTRSPGRSSVPGYLSYAEKHLEVIVYTKQIRAKTT